MPSKKHAGKKRWTKTFYIWLETVKFGYVAQQIAFQDYIDAVEQTSSRVSKLDQELERALLDWEWKPIADALMALRGVSVITAMTILTELGDLRRFEHPRQLMSYLGLVPSEYSSGKKQTRGAITKTGNSAVRRLLIEASWLYRLTPMKTRHWKSKAQYASVEVQAISWKAMKCLHKRYHRLINRGIKPCKVATADEPWKCG